MALITEKTYQTYCDTSKEEIVGIYILHSIEQNLQRTMPKEEYIALANLVYDLWLSWDTGCLGDISYELCDLVDENEKFISLPYNEMYGLLEEKYMSRNY